MSDKSNLNRKESTDKSTVDERIEAQLELANSPATDPQELATEGADAIVNSKENQIPAQPRQTTE
jgi:hypothetical protein